MTTLFLRFQSLIEQLLLLLLLVAVSGDYTLMTENIASQTVGLNKKHYQKLIFQLNFLYP
jgi:hypothetical protein